MFTGTLFAQMKLVDASSKIEYAIEWHLNGGTQNPANKNFYTAEDGMILAAPTREGYAFDGWYTKADLSGDKVTAIAKGETQKKVFYAGWVITKEQAVKIMKEEMITVIPAGMKTNLDDFAGTSGTQIINAYEISKHEITQELYMAVMEKNPSYYKIGAAPGEVQEKRPVENVSWYDACDFCNKLSKIMVLTPCYDENYDCNYSANGFRLPSEGEWEAAARGGTAGGWDYEYSGSNNLSGVAWYEDNSFNDITDERTTHEIGKKTPNALGLYDMSGNVWEWCDNKDSSSSSYRVNRGGGFTCYDNSCKVSCRDSDSADTKSKNLGFRVVRSLFTAEEEKAVLEQKAQSLKNLVNSFVYVEGGTFQMGSNSGANDEKPVHNVSLSSYYIAKAEITQAQWSAIMGNNNSYFKGDNRPVECVSWFDAIVFCNKLSMMDKRTPVYSVNGNTDPDTWNYKPCNRDSINGNITMNIKANGYRLPTEAEWEFAALGGKKRKDNKYSGSDNLDAVAWYEGNSGGKTHDVATKSPNELGLYDMSGNVWKWCWDWYASYSSNQQTNPIGAISGSSRILRGGCWDYGFGLDYYCRVTNRYNDTPNSRYVYNGFRLVRNAN